MKTTRILLVIIVAISLAGLTTAVQAQDTPAAGAAAAPAAEGAPAAPTTPAAPAGDAPVLTEGDRSGDETAPSDSTKSNEAPTSQPSGDSPSIFNPQMIFLLGAMVLFFVFMGRGKRKTEAKRKEMLSALKKGDKVTTIGGIIGTVMDIRENEVTIKIDENNNTRMRFIRSAVRGVGDEAKKEDVEEQK